MRPDDHLPFESFKLNGLACSVCGLQQRETPGGQSCPNGHGGAEGVPIKFTEQERDALSGVSHLVPSAPDAPVFEDVGQAVPISVPRSETRLVFLDLETTGLLPEKHFILEVGACVVSAELDYLSAIAGPESDRLFFHRYPQWATGARSLLLTADEHVQKMHLESGLIDDSDAARQVVSRQLSTVADGAVPGVTVGRIDEVVHDGIRHVEDDLIDWLVTGHHFEPKTAVLVGSGINFDRSFIKARMPKLDAFLHYRMLDVTALREAHRRWVDPLYEKPTPPHRVKGDIRSALDELRLFRAHARDAEMRGAIWLWQAMAAGEINTRSTRDEIEAAVEAAREGAR